MSLWISARSKPEYGNSGWRTSRKKFALWAFQPALRGGFNYTLLELEDVATVLIRQWQYTKCDCVDHWWYSRLCLVLCALLISKLRYRDLLFDWSLLHTERSRCVIALSVGPPATPHWALPLNCTSAEIVITLPEVSSMTRPPQENSCRSPGEAVTKL